MFLTFLGLFFGPLLLGFVKFSYYAFSIQMFVKVALALLLFLGAVTVNVKVVKRYHPFGVKVSLVQSVMTLLLVLTFGRTLLQMPWVQLIILGALLIPTDLRVSPGIFLAPSRPVQILHVESVTNQGISLVLLALIFFQAQAFFICLLTIGIALAVAYCIPKNSPFLGYIWLLLALLIFFTSPSLIMGYLAVYVFGLLIGNFFRYLCGPLIQWMRREGTYLHLLGFFFLGASFIPSLIGYLTPSVFLFSLTFPLFVRLFTLSFCKQPFLCYFAPKGLVSMGLALTLFPHLPVILAPVIWATFLSIWIYGLTLFPILISTSEKDEVPIVNLPVE